MGYLHLVFGAETTIRAIQKPAFQPRKRFATLGCIFAVNVLILITFIVARVNGYDQDRCLGSATFRAASLLLNKAIVAVLVLFTVIGLAMSATITVQLFKTVHMDPAERISASRMAYYLNAMACFEVSHASKNTI